MFRSNKKLFEPILTSCCGKKFHFYFDQLEKYLHIFVKNFNGWGGSVESELKKLDFVRMRIEFKLKDRFESFLR